MCGLFPRRYRKRALSRSVAIDNRMLRAATSRLACSPTHLVWLLTIVLTLAVAGTGSFPASPSGEQQAPPSGGAASQIPPIVDPFGTTKQAAPRPDSTSDVNGPLTKKQKQDLLKSNFEKLKRDADELATLAKSLQQDLDKSNENVLSLKVLDRTEKIEKLARKIKSEAKGD